jgi:hypothetical protein
LRTGGDMAAAHRAALAAAAALRGDAGVGHIAGGVSTEGSGSVASDGGAGSAEPHAGDSDRAARGARKAKLRLNTAAMRGRSGASGLNRSYAADGSSSPGLLSRLPPGAGGSASAGPSEPASRTTSPGSTASAASGSPYGPNAGAAALRQLQLQGGMGPAGSAMSPDSSRTPSPSGSHRARGWRWPGSGGGSGGGSASAREQGHGEAAAAAAVSGSLSARPAGSGGGAGWRNWLGGLVSPGGTAIGRSMSARAAGSTSPGSVAAAAAAGVPASELGCLLELEGEAEIGTVLLRAPSPADAEYWRTGLLSICRQFGCAAMPGSTLHALLHTREPPAAAAATEAPIGASHPDSQAHGAAESLPLREPGVFRAATPPPPRQQQRRDSVSGASVAVVVAGSGTARRRSLDDVAAAAAIQVAAAAAAASASPDARRSGSPRDGRRSPKPAGGDGGDGAAAASAQVSAVLGYERQSTAAANAFAAALGRRNSPGGPTPARDRAAAEEAASSSGRAAPHASPRSSGRALSPGFGASAPASSSSLRALRAAGSAASSAASAPGERGRAPHAGDGVFPAIPLREGRRGSVTDGPQRAASAGSAVRARSLSPSFAAGVAQAAAAAASAEGGEGTGSRDAADGVTDWAHRQAPASASRTRRHTDQADAAPAHRRVLSNGSGTGEGGFQHRRRISRGLSTPDVARSKPGTFKWLLHQLRTLASPRGGSAGVAAGAGRRRAAGARVRGARHGRDASDGSAEAQEAYEAQQHQDEGGNGRAAGIASTAKLSANRAIDAEAEAANSEGVSAASSVARPTAVFSNVMRSAAATTAALAAVGGPHAETGVVHMRSGTYHHHPHPPHQGRAHAAAGAAATADGAAYAAGAADGSSAQDEAEDAQLLRHMYSLQGRETAGGASMASTESGQTAAFTGAFALPRGEYPMSLAVSPATPESAHPSSAAASPFPLALSGVSVSGAISDADAAWLSRLRVPMPGMAPTPADATTAGTVLAAGSSASGGSLPPPPGMSPRPTGLAARGRASSAASLSLARAAEAVAVQGAAEAAAASTSSYEEAESPQQQQQLLPAPDSQMSAQLQLRLQRLRVEAARMDSLERSRRLSEFIAQKQADARGRAGRLSVTEGAAGASAGSTSDAITAYERSVAGQQPPHKRGFELAPSTAAEASDASVLVEVDEDGVPTTTVTVDLTAYYPIILSTAASSAGSSHAASPAAGARIARGAAFPLSAAKHGEDREPTAATSGAPSVPHSTDGLPPPLPAIPSAAGAAVPASPSLLIGADAGARSPPGGRRRVARGSGYAVGSPVVAAAAAPPPGMGASASLGAGLGEGRATPLAAAGDLRAASPAAQSRLLSQPKRASVVRAALGLLASLQGGQGPAVEGGSRIVLPPSGAVLERARAAVNSRAVRLHSRVAALLTAVTARNSDGSPRSDSSTAALPLVEAAPAVATCLAELIPLLREHADAAAGLLAAACGPDAATVAGARAARPSTASQLARFLAVGVADSAAACPDVFIRMLHAAGVADPSGADSREIIACLSLWAGTGPCQFVASPSGGGSLRWSAGFAPLRDAMLPALGQMGAAGAVTHTQAVTLLAGHLLAPAGLRAIPWPAAAALAVLHSQAGPAAIADVLKHSILLPEITSTGEEAGVFSAGLSSFDALLSTRHPGISDLWQLLGCAWSLLGVRVGSAALHASLSAHSDARAAFSTAAESRVVAELKTTAERCAQFLSAVPDLSAAALRGAQVALSGLPHELQAVTDALVATLADGSAFAVLRPQQVSSHALVCPADAFALSEALSTLQAAVPTTAQPPRLGHLRGRLDRALGAEAAVWRRPEDRHVYSHLPLAPSESAAARPERGPAVTGQPGGLVQLPPATLDATREQLLHLQALADECGLPASDTAGEPTAFEIWASGTLPPALEAQLVSAAQAVSAASSHVAAALLEEDVLAEGLQALAAGLEHVEALIVARRVPGIRVSGPTPVSGTTPAVRGGASPREGSAAAAPPTVTAEALAEARSVTAPPVAAPQPATAASPVTSASPATGAAPRRAFASRTAAGSAAGLQAAAARVFGGVQPLGLHASPPGAHVRSPLPAAPPAVPATVGGPLITQATPAALAQSAAAPTPAAPAHPVFSPSVRASGGGRSEEAAIPTAHVSLFSPDDDSDVVRSAPEPGTRTRTSSYEAALRHLQQPRFTSPSFASPTAEGADAVPTVTASLFSPPSLGAAGEAPRPLYAASAPSPQLSQQGSFRRAPPQAPLPAALPSLTHSSPLPARSASVGPYPAAGYRTGRSSVRSVSPGGRARSVTFADPVVDAHITAAARELSDADTASVISDDRRGGVPQARGAGATLSPSARGLGAPPTLYDSGVMYAHRNATPARTLLRPASDSSSVMGSGASPEPVLSATGPATVSLAATLDLQPPLRTVEPVSPPVSRRGSAASAASAPAAVPVPAVLSSPAVNLTAGSYRVESPAPPHGSYGGRVSPAGGAGGGVANPFAPSVLQQRQQQQQGYYGPRASPVRHGSDAAGGSPGGMRTPPAGRQSGSSARSAPAGGPASLGTLLRSLVPPSFLARPSSPGRAGAGTSPLPRSAGAAEERSPRTPVQAQATPGVALNSGRSADARSSSSGGSVLSAARLTNSGPLFTPPQLAGIRSSSPTLHAQSQPLVYTSALRVASALASPPSAPGSSGRSPVGTARAAGSAAANPLRMHPPPTFGASPGHPSSGGSLASLLRTNSFSASNMLLRQRQGTATTSPSHPRPE